MAARSTTQGTPVKSCNKTRAGMNEISLRIVDVGVHDARALMSSAFTNPLSSRRSRFSSRIFSENGSRVMFGKPAFSRFCRQYIETVCAPDLSDVLVVNVSRETEAMINRS
jgi:hypothetical protein